MMSDLLQFVRFKDLIDSWSIKDILKINLFTTRYKQIKLSDFLLDLTKHRKITIDDNTEYTEPTISSKTNTISTRKKALGRDFKVKKRVQIKKGDLVFARLHTQNGLFAFSDNDFVSTSTFIPCSFDATKIEKEYLYIALKRFLRYLSSNDSVGRETYKAVDILNLKIPLPPLEIQQKLVKNYQDKLNLAEQQTKQFQQKEVEIETYLYQQLGIELPKEEKQNTDILQFVRFKDLSYWSYNQLFLKKYFNSKYTITDFSNICNFKNKIFDTSNYKKDLFNYIDIGSVNPLNGILSSKKIPIEKAPSRATQYANTGDLIIATTRPYLRKFAIVDKGFDGYVYSSGFTVIEKNINQYNLYYIKEFLQSFYGVEQLKENMTGGLYPAITLANLKSIQIPLPPLKIQNQIASHIENIKNEIQTLKQQAEQNQANALSEFEAEIFNAS